MTEIFCLAFILTIYLVNFKYINKEIIYIWNRSIKETRISYYLENYPYGYYFPTHHKRDTNFPNKIWAKQKYYLDTLYNRKMMKK